MKGAQELSDKASSCLVNTPPERVYGLSRPDILSIYQLKRSISKNNYDIVGKKRKVGMDVFIC